MTYSFQKFMSFFLSFLLLFSLSSCNEPPTETVQSMAPNNASIASDSTKKAVITLAIPASPIGISVAALLEKSAGNVTVDHFIGRVFPTDSEVATAIKDDSADIALLPINKAVQLYQSSGGEIQLRAILSQSDLSIVTSGENIVSFSDLSGHVIASTGEGDLTGAALTALLEKSSVDATIDYVANDASLLSVLPTNKDSTVCLGEPSTSEALKNRSFFAPIQLSSVWSENFDGNYFPYACLVV